MGSEINLSYITRDNVDPRGKARVYFSYHPDDFVYLEHIGKLLLKRQDCALYYYDYKEQGDPQIEELTPLLREMQLFVVPVTSNFLFKSCIAFDYEFQYAIKNNIPILPLLQDSELGAEFNRKCGNLQYFDEYSKDRTAISFGDKLEKYLQSVLVSDEAIKRIQAAFDAYVFLSYRKKDREYAQKLMTLIHANPLCRDIAIWYDEFLLPGEPFDKAIEAMLKKSDLFALLVTPNLVNEDNYVQSVEFPTAKEAGKEIIAAEAKHTSKSKLKKSFKDLPRCVKISDERALNKELISKLKRLAIRENNTPEHNFLIGLAFLAGIDVEYNPEYAVELITDAAAADLTEAVKKLVDVYYRGIGAARDIKKAIHWQRKYIDIIQTQILSEKDEKAVAGLLESRTELANYLTEAGRLEEAEKVHIDSISLVEKLSEENFETFSQYLSVEFGNIGVFYIEIGKTTKAESYLLKASQINDERMKRDPYADKGSVALSYNNLGMLFLEKGDFEKASDYLNKSIDLLIDLVVAEPDKYSYYYALACDNLGVVYHHNNNSEKAEEFFGYAIKVREHLAAMNPEVFNGDLALGYNNAFAFFGDQNEYKKASEYLKKAIALFEELIQTNPELYRKYLAQCYQNAGLFYKEHGEYAESEKHLLLSKKYYERLACIVPERFENDLADNLNILGVFYLEMGRIAEAEKCLAESLRMREQLYKTDSDRYAIDLAYNYNNIGHLMMQSDMESALDYLVKAVDVFEQSKDQSGDTYYEGYSSTCNNLGMLYKETGEAERAKLWIGKSLEIRKQMSEMNHARYDGELAFGYNNMGIVLLEHGDFEEAFLNFESAIGIYERIKDTDPERYRDELAICYANAYTCKNMMGDNESALRYLLDAVSEYETLEQRMPEIYVEDLSTCYNNAGIAYEENREFEKAEHYYLLSVDLLTKYLNKRIDLAYTLSVSLGNLGMLYEENQESKKALDYYQKAVQVIKNVEPEDIGSDSYVSQLIGLYERLIDVCPKAGKASLVSMYKKELEKLNKT